MISLELPEGLFLYAVPVSTPVPADLAGKIAVLRGGAGVLRSKRLVDLVHLVGESTDPAIVTEYRVAIGDALVVEQVGDGATPHVLPRTYLIPGASVVVILVVLAMRRRRSKRTAGSTR